MVRIIRDQQLYNFQFAEQDSFLSTEHRGCVCPGMAAPF